MNYEDFKRIKTVNIPCLLETPRRSVGFKNISINMVIPEITLPGDWLQFGVFKGHTARILESYILPGRKLHLFDSFEGLPEEWSNTNFGKGHFKIAEGSIPQFDPRRSVIHKGWFSDTLGPYKEKYPNPISFIHLDADLYSSTMTVLEELNDQIIPGTILLFDEFFLPSNRGISDDECRAFHEWAEQEGRQFQILWRTAWVQCAIKILK